MSESNWALNEDTPPAVCCMHKRFVPCRRDAEDCDISTHPADVEHVLAYQLGEPAR